MVGDDPAGRMIVAELGARGVKADVTVADGPTGTFVLADGDVRVDRGVGHDLVLPDRIEADVVLGLTDAQVHEALAAFCAARGIDARDPLLSSALIGTPDIVRARIAEYAGAGATDLMLGFADFPSTRMTELFAERVLAAE